MIEDLSVFFQDFGVDAVHATGTIKVLLDSKDTFNNADVARFKNYDISALKITKELPALAPQDSLVVDGDLYKVAEFEKIDDGKFTRVYLIPM